MLFVKVGEPLEQVRLLTFSTKLKGRVAPTGRAADSKSVGCEFESCHARHLLLVFLFSFLPLGLLQAKELSWKVGHALQSRWIDGDTVNLRAFGIVSSIVANHRLSPSLEVSTKGQIRLRVASSNSFYVKDYDPEKQLVLRWAYLSWRPYTPLSFRMGVLGKKEVDFPLLMSKETMGVVEKFALPLGKGEAYLQLQQSFLSNNLFIKSGEVEKENPLFFYGRGGIKFPYGVLEVGYYSFKNLSTKAADKSRYMGSSTNGNNEEVAEFLYPFEGVIFQGGPTIPFKRGKIVIRGNYLRNNKAPDDKNEGYIAKVGVKFPSWTIYGGYFLNQSDTSPGTYNERYYGHNNRVGEEVGGVLKFTNYHLKFNYRRTRIYDDDAVNAQYQGKVNFIKISIKLTNL